MTAMDAFRIKRNYGYMIRSIPGKQEDEYEQCGKAVLEHHFGNHVYCGDWCSQKQLSEEERKASTRYYRNKTKDAKLYEVLSGLLARFITKAALKEIAHAHDTQVNESLNNLVSWFAQKNKVYCSSGSLRNRISMAIGIHSVGHYEFFTRLFKLLGIAADPDVRYFLEQRGRDRFAKIARAKKPAFKRKRMQSDFDKLKANTLIAKRERDQRDGTYQTGMGMDGGYTEQDFEDGGGQQDEASLADNKKAQKKQCKRCKRFGHLTANSKSCMYYKSKRQRTATAVGGGVVATQQDITERDKAEADAIEQLPLDTPLDDDDEDEDFYDAPEGGFELFESLVGDSDDEDAAPPQLRGFI